MEFIRKKKRDESLCNFSAKKKSRSFYQIYLPPYNSHKLLIPPQFIKHLNEDDIPEALDLKNVQGDIWTVQLDITCDNKVFMSQGWKQYVKDHSLGRGDFLVFSKTLGYSGLYVEVFGLDGCLKEEPFIENVTHEKPRGTAFATRAAGREDASSRYLRFYKIYRTDFKSFVGVPKHVLVACNFRIPQEIILRSNEGHAIKTHLRETNDRVVVGYVGLSEFWRKCKVKNGDKLQFIAILGEARTIKVIEVSKTK